MLDSVADVARLREAHEQGIPVVVRAASAEAVKAAWPGRRSRAHWYPIRRSSSSICAP